MKGLLYTLIVGLPFCFACMTFGVLLCATVIGIPAGLTLMALGFKTLTLSPRPQVVMHGVLSAPRPPQPQGWHVRPGSPLARLLGR